MSSIRSAKYVQLNLHKYNYDIIIGRSFYVSAPTNCSSMDHKLPANLRCEMKYNIFRRKVLSFININNLYIYLFSFVSF